MASFLRNEISGLRTKMLVIEMLVHMMKTKNLITEVFPFRFLGLAAN